MRSRTRRTVGVVVPLTTNSSITEAVASCAIKVTGRAFVNNANDSWAVGPIQTIRYNRSRTVRIAGVTAGSIAFAVQGIPGGNGQVAVLSNGVFVAYVQCNGGPQGGTDATPQWFSVALPPGAKTVELWEDFQQRSTNLDTGADGTATGAYVAAVAVPSGASIVQATATTGIAAYGDSHMDGVANYPWSVNGWCGQLRQAAQAKGWLLGYVGAGSSTLCGDGPTAAQTAQMIHDLWANMGCTVKKFLMMRRPNDYAYWGGVGAINTVPRVSDGAGSYEAYLTAVFAALDASDPGWTGICTRIPQGTGWAANGGGFTLANYWTATVNAATASGRSNVQTFDGSVDVNGLFGLVLASDFSEGAPNQVHPIQTGHNKIFSVVRTWYGL